METRGGRDREVEHLRPARARQKAKEIPSPFAHGTRVKVTAMHLPHYPMRSSIARGLRGIRVCVRVRTRAVYTFSALSLHRLSHTSALFGFSERATSSRRVLWTGRVTVRSAIYALNNALCLPLAEPRVL